MPGHDIVHVAIAPPDSLEATLIKREAAVVNKDPWETRLLLARKIPRIIAHYENNQTAESIAQSLRELGLMAIVCRDSELHLTKLQGTNVGNRGARSLILGRGASK